MGIIKQYPELNQSIENICLRYQYEPATADNINKMYSEISYDIKTHDAFRNDKINNILKDEDHLFKSDSLGVFDPDCISNSLIDIETPIFEEKVSIQEEIFEKIDEAKKLMKEKFPNNHHTIKILMWDDGDYLVECRHATPDLIIHNFKYHKSKGAFEFSSNPCVSNAIKVDEYGKEYYVPNELIPYLNKPIVEPIVDLYEN